MGRIVRAARNHCAESLYISSLASNAGMQGFTRKFTTDLCFETYDTRRLVARSPSAASVWGEFADNSSSFAIAVIDLQTRVYSMQRRV